MTPADPRSRRIDIGRLLLTLILGLLLSQPVLAQAISPQALLVEAAGLLRQADAADDEGRMALLRQAQERLRRIVAEFPDSDLARELSGPGVAVMGGPRLSLVAVAQRLQAELQRAEHLNRYGEVQVHPDGTVTIHGRQWMRCSLGQRWEPVPGQLIGGTCSGDALSATWEDAHRLANELNQGVGFAGYRDWRLPTITELEVLRLCSSGLTERSVEIGNTVFFEACSGDYESPTIDLALFPNTPRSSFFWSGSPSAHDPNSAWRVYFDYGYVDYNFRSRSAHVRLVRSVEHVATTPEPTAGQHRELGAPRDKEELELTRTKLSSLLQFLPSTAEIPSLLVDISQAALSVGLEIELFQPRAEVRRVFYAEVPIQLRVRGNYEQLGEFLSSISLMPRTVTVHDLFIRTGRSDDDLLMDAEIRTYRRLEEGAANLNLEKLPMLNDRIDVVQALQASRVEAVQLLDQLLAALPPGVFIRELQRDGSRVRIVGRAESNAHISALMRNVDASPSLTDATLQIIGTQHEGPLEPRDFRLEVRQIVQGASPPHALANHALSNAVRPQARLALARNAYLAEVQSSIERRWRKPEGLQSGDQAFVLVRIDPDTGRIRSFTVQECSGSAAFCDSVRQTMERLPILPRPPDVESVRDGIRVRLAPDQG